MNQKHYAAAVSAFVIWGFFSIPLRALQNYSAGEILYFRILFSAITLLIIISFFKRNELRHDRQIFVSMTAHKKRTVLLLTLVGGALLCVNWLTFIYTVNAINIKTASFSYLICPVITAVLGYVLIRERLTVLQWISVGLCAISCVIMGLSSLLELGYSFLTALTYALYLISQRKNQGFDRILVLGVQILFSLFLLTLIYGYLIDAVPDAPGFYGIITVIAIFFTVLPLFLNLFALNKINSATIGILMYINPIINFTIALIIFKEHVTALQVIGYSIISIALVLFNYPYLRKIRTTALGN
ncbi:EamA family transporter [Chryseolinea sp. H1M3-3]|uniref:EamA family transporter n=1 Tax=Chryseolinea sp. H1M3-3 TaxID=3034144 RepID=UPI0023EE1272|nr:EamA family transporter [Chryseolinea sp. H1M3-3]